MTKTILILLSLLGFGMLANSLDVYRTVGYYDGKDYYAALNTTQHDGHIYERCRAKYGQGAYVLEVDDAGEWDFLKTQLSANFACNGCTRNFWTNGKYDITTASNKGVVITVTNNVVATKVALNTDYYRYICEVPTTTTTTARPTYTPNTQTPPPNPTPVEECTNDNDLIIVLDSSGSIGAENYKKEKVFAYDLARSFQGATDSRFGLTIFATPVATIIPLTNALTDAAINDEILNADFMASTTNTDLGIDNAAGQFASSPRSVPQNMVIITDGLSNNPLATIDAANDAIAAGIRTFAVGIGLGANYVELLAIAGGDPTRVFTTLSFDDLSTLVVPVSQAVCEP